jgi:hypothetical protein
VPKHTNRLTSGWILSLDPSVSRRTRLATAKDDPHGDGTDSLSETLKLLAVSVEDGLHIMIMILIEPTNLLWFLGTLQLSGHVAILRTVARLDR